MNLHGIVRTAIKTVNPEIDATLLKNTGNTTANDGKRTPVYEKHSDVKIQVQGVSSHDLQHVDSLNIQGVLRKVYLLGNWAGAIRADQRGGDIMKFPQVPGADVQDWLVVAVTETWADWCAVIVCLQSTTVTV